MRNIFLAAYNFHENKQSQNKFKIHARQYFLIFSYVRVLKQFHRLKIHQTRKIFAGSRRQFLLQEIARKVFFEFGKQKIKYSTSLWLDNLCRESQRHIHNKAYNEVMISIR